MNNRLWFLPVSVLLIACVSSVHCNQKFVTWDIPVFTGFNNELVIHIQLMHLVEAMGRKLVSPGWEFQPSPGYQTFPELFNTTLPGLSDYFRFTEIEELGTAVEVNMETVFTSDEPFVRITDQEGLWAYVFKRWIVTMHISPETSSSLLDLYQFRSGTHIANTVSRVVEGFELDKRVIGVHLRGDEWRDRCEGVLRNDPRKFVFSCYQETADEIINHIERVKGDTDRVFIATNHPLDHPVLNGLRDRYGKDLLTWDSFHIVAEDWERGLIENELLRSCHSFMGNYFSTYTQVIALKRHLVRSYIFKTRFMGMQVDHLLLMLAVLIAVGICMLARKYYIRWQRVRSGIKTN